MRQSGVGGAGGNSESSDSGNSDSSGSERRDRERSTKPDGFGTSDAYMNDTSTSYRSSGKNDQPDPDRIPTEMG